MDGATETKIDELLAEGCLVVDFCGELRVLQPGDQLTFGREADLFIDENQHLHRRLGRFEHNAGSWWVANTGTKIDLKLYDGVTRASAVITPGTSQALNGADLVLGFVAGRHTYELLLRCPPVVAVEVAPSTDTVGIDSVAWTDEQRLLLSVLAEDLIRNPASADTFKLPSNETAQSRLGWSGGKFNRKLDSICERLTLAGVRGLEKGVNKRNNLRRRVLATYAVGQNIVGVDDLADLSRHEQQVAD